MKIRIYLNDVNEQTSSSFSHCNFFTDYSDMTENAEQSYVEYVIDGIDDIPANAQIALASDPNVIYFEIMSLKGEIIWKIKKFIVMLSAIITI